MTKDSGSPRYYVMGQNARLNINSTDSSVNIVNTSNQLFGEMRSAVERGLEDIESRQHLLSRIAALESAPDQRTRLERHQELVASAANHITVLSPFFPALAQLLAQ